MVALYTCIRGILGSNLGWDVGYSHRYFIAFLMSLQVYYEIIPRLETVASFRNLSHSSISLAFILGCIVKQDANYYGSGIWCSVHRYDCLGDTWKMPFCLEVGSSWFLRNTGLWYTKLHGVTMQKTAIFASKGVRTWTPNKQQLERHKR
jgi:hypothetical protein